MATVAELKAENEERMSRKEVIALDYHRNGVSGDGFFVGLIRDPDQDQRVLMAVVPSWAVPSEEDPEDVQDEGVGYSPAGCIPCYVIDPMIAAGHWTRPGSVEFGVNSFRGDHFFNVMKEAILKFRENLITSQYPNV